jgi:hypothetical protein
MVRAKNVLVVPFWVLLVAAALLLAILGQAKPVLAPTSTFLPATSSVASPALASSSQPATNAAVQRTIDALVPVALPNQRGLAPVAQQKAQSTNVCSTNGVAPAMHPACITGGSVPIGR